MPAPIEHGDLFREHLAVSRDGQLAAIDWELGRREGLAGADAATFLLDVFRAPAGGLAGEGTALTYARQFLDSRGLARHWMEDHLERQGVDRRWVNHILLATFARRALHIWEPVVTETVTAPAPEQGHARALFRSFWSLRLWRMTLEQMSG